MRAILFFSGTALLLAVAGLLLWRPALMLGLAILGGAINLWRMHRPHHTAPKAAAGTRRVVVLDEVNGEAPADDATPTASEEPPQPHADLLTRIRSAGWALHAAKSAFPWLIAVAGGVRVALRPRPQGAHVTADDLQEAMAARDADGAQFVAIICEHRPSEGIAILAKDNRVHIVSLARLEPYLALALSFKPQSAKPAPTLGATLAVS